VLLGQARVLIRGGGGEAMRRELGERGHGDGNERRADDERASQRRVRPERNNFRRVRWWVARPGGADGYMGPRVMGLLRLRMAEGGVSAFGQAGSVTGGVRWTRRISLFCGTGLSCSGDILGGNPRRQQRSPVRFLSGLIPFEFLFCE
jgi:hypothetical protein